MSVPAKAIAEITQARSDVEILHWDEAYYEDTTEEWIVPVEAYFTEADGSEDLGWNHGNMHVEVDAKGGAVDFYIHDWAVGKHPDLHTYER